MDVSWLHLLTSRAPANVQCGSKGNVLSQFDVGLSAGKSSGDFTDQYSVALGTTGSGSNLPINPASTQATLEQIVDIPCVGASLGKQGCDDLRLFQRHGISPGLVRR